MKTMTPRQTTPRDMLNMRFKDKIETRAPVSNPFTSRRTRLYYCLLVNLRSYRPSHYYTQLPLPLSVELFTRHKAHELQLSARLTLEYRTDASQPPSISHHSSRRPPQHQHVRRLQSNPHDLPHSPPLQQTAIPTPLALRLQLRPAWVGRRESP
jgi:hypothetical protein